MIFKVLALVIEQFPHV